MINTFPETEPNTLPSTVLSTTMNTLAYQAFREMDEHPQTITADDLEQLLRVAFLPQEGLYNTDTVELARMVTIRHAVKKGIKLEVTSIDDQIHRTSTPDYVEIEHRIMEMVAYEREHPYFQPMG